MIGGAAHCHGVFFQIAVSRRGFAGIQNDGLVSFQRSGIPSGSGGNSAKTLEEIQRSPFRRQKRLCGTAHFGNHFSIMTAGTVGFDDPVIANGIQPGKDPFRHFLTCHDHIFFFAAQNGNRFGFRSDHSQSCHIAGSAQIFGDRHFDQRIHPFPINRRQLVTHKILLVCYTVNSL